jgi:hypothetical protein
VSATGLPIAPASAPAGFASAIIVWRFTGTRTFSLDSAARRSPARLQRTSIWQILAP